MSKARVKVKARVRARRRRVTGKAFKLFAMGVALTAVALLLALLVSRVAGYALALVPASLSLYILLRWGRDGLCKALGLGLLALSAISIASVATIQRLGWSGAIGGQQLGISTASSPRPKNVTTLMGVPMDVDTWRITLEDVREVKQVSVDGRLYSSREGMKIVLARMKIENIGRYEVAPRIWNFTLVTDANRSYIRVYPSNLVEVSNASAGADVEQYLELDLLTRVKPNNAIEGHLLFHVPEGEKPKELHLNVGLLEPTKVIIAIRREP